MQGFVKDIRDVVGAIECVRQIQRGVVKFDASSSDNVNVTLRGFSNVNKMMVILDGNSHYYNSGYGAYAILPYVFDLTTSKLSIGKSDFEKNKGKNNHVSYQVIEFY